LFNSSREILSGAAEIEVHAIDPLRDVRWSRFIQAHPDGSIFHTTAWLQALGETYGYQPIAYIDSASEKEISNGQVFCQVNSWLTGKRLVSVPFSDHAALLVDGRDSCQFILAALKQKVNDNQCRYIEVRPTGDAPLDQLGLRKASTFYLHTIALDRGLGSIHRSFHKNCVQRTIARAEREGLTYEEGTSEKLIGQFYRLLLLTHERHRTPTQPISWFRNLAHFLGQSMKIRVASKGGRPIAAMITLSFKKTMTYKYGCSDAKYHKLGAVASLFWRSIQEAKSSDMQTFDMGRTDTNNPGLIAFKEHWGAQRKTLDYWRYPAKVLMAPQSWEFKAAKAAFSRVPNFALRTAGTFLYKHMA
jgi:hypothetical protein